MQLPITIQQFICLSTLLIFLNACGNNQQTTQQENTIMDTTTVDAPPLTSNSEDSIYSTTSFSDTLTSGGFENPGEVEDPAPDKSDTTTVEGVIVNAFDTGIYMRYGVEMETTDGAHISFDYYDKDDDSKPQHIDEYEMLNRRATIRYYENEEGALTIASITLYEKVEIAPLNSLFIGDWVLSNLEAKNTKAIKIRFGRTVGFYIDFGQGEQYYRTDVKTNSIEGSNEIGDFKMELLTENPATMSYAVKNKAGHIVSQKFKRISNETSQLIIGRWKNIGREKDIIEFTNKELILSYESIPYTIATVYMNKYHHKDHPDEQTDTSNLISILNLNSPITSWRIIQLNDTLFTYMRAGARPEIGEGKVMKYKRIQ